MAASGVAAILPPYVWERMERLGGVEDEQTLIERARAGDEAAIDLLCRQNEHAVRQRLLQRLPARLHKRISVSDVVQEALMTAVRRLREDQLPFEGSFRNWLLGIADFKAREAARFHLGTAKRALDAELSTPHRPDTEALRQAPGSASSGPMRAESRQQIDAGLAGLPEDYRRVIELVHRHGCTTAEAGEHMDRSPEAARKLYARAIAALAKRVNPEGSGD
jgi:RNA polymerase sigma-70 factor (ECF subfamily)